MERRKWAATARPYAYLAPALAVIAFIYAYPLFRLFRASFYREGGGVPVFVGWTNYAVLFRNPLFWRSVRNNVILLLNIPLTILLSTVFAALLYDRVRGWKLYQIIFFFPYVLSVVTVAISFSLILQQRGILNLMLTRVGLGFLAQNWIGSSKLALFSVMGVMVWSSLGFGIVLFLARLMRAPMELYDAAKVDGAGWWQQFIHVTIPQLRNVIIFYGMTLLVGSFSSVFAYILEMTGGGPAASTFVSDFYIYLMAFKYHSMGEATAFAVMLFMLVVVLTVVQSWVASE